MSDSHDKPLGPGIDWADPRSRLAGLYLTPGGVAGVAVLCVLTLVLATGPLWHTDFWSHLRYGEVMAATGRRPDREPLTPFAAPGRPSADLVASLSQPGSTSPWQNHTDFWWKWSVVSPAVPRAIGQPRVTAAPLGAVSG